MDAASKSLLSRLVVPLLLLWMLVAGLFLAWRDSMTTDEGIHISSGYLALTRGDFRFDPEHPFLFKMLSALPLLPLRLNAPSNDQQLWEQGQPIVYDSWREARSWGNEWFYQSGNDADRMLFLARLPSVLFLVLLGWLVYFLGRTWYSEAVGRWALFFTAFNPTVLAHGHLANDDLAVTVAFLAALYALWLYGRRQGPKETALVAGSLAAALLIKFSAVALLPAAGIWLLYVAWRERQWKTAARNAALALLIGWILIWIGYGGPLSWPGLHQMVLNTTQPLPDQFLPYKSLVTRFAADIRWVLPIAFAKGFLLVLFSSIYGRPAYLLETTYFSGVWFYFPVLFLLKTQLVAIGLLLAGLYGAVAGRFWKRLASWKDADRLLALSFLVFGALSLKSKLDIGIRHILPLLALFSFYLARMVCSERRWQRIRIFLPAVGAAYALPVLLQFSHLIGFANLLAAPGGDTYRYFNDSNLDWGWQSKELASQAKSLFPGNTIYANYHWSPLALPYYGLQTKGFDPSKPPTGAVIALTGTQMSYPEYAGFRSLSPIARLDNSVYFFKLPAASK